MEQLDKRMSAIEAGYNALREWTEARTKNELHMREEIDNLFEALDMSVVALTKRMDELSAKIDQLTASSDALRLRQIDQTGTNRNIFEQLDKMQISFNRRMITLDAAFQQRIDVLDNVLAQFNVSTLALDQRLYKLEHPSVPISDSFPINE